MPDVGPVVLVSADRVSSTQRAALMNAAYADYYVPVRVTPEQMSLMDEFYDNDPMLSVVARAPWEPVGMALLAVRGHKAWVSGVGVVPSWRGKGVGRQMMRWLLANARIACAYTVQLEVITQNLAAKRLYASLGFREARELVTWQRPAEADPLPVMGERLKAADPLELVTEALRWRRQPPCWQREAETLRKMSAKLNGYRLEWHGETAALCLVSAGEESIALTDVSVNPDAGLLMPVRLMLQALAGVYWGRALSIMNVPSDDPLSRVLSALGFLVTLRQMEMVLDLREEP